MLNEKIHVGEKLVLSHKAKQGHTKANTFGKEHHTHTHTQSWEKKDVRVEERGLS